MARAYCNACQRPQLSCVCKYSTQINNQVELVVFQHPSEQNHSKNTVPLLSLSFIQCTVIVGEDFSEQLKLLRQKYPKQLAMLYPSDKAVPLVNSGGLNEEIKNIKCLIVLDGTWKKAYKLFKLNPQLNELPHFILDECFQGQYHIRKTKKQGALSTLEASCYALGILENNDKKYQVLIDKFVEFNHFKQAFVPAEHKN